MYSGRLDRKSTRLNSSHLGISYAVFCLKKKKRILRSPLRRHRIYRRLRPRCTGLAGGVVLCWLLGRLFFFNDTAPTEIYTLSLHDALPIYVAALHLGVDAAHEAFGHGVRGC